MGLFSPPADAVLCDAIRSRQGSVQLNHVVGPFELLLRKAVKRDIRILALLDSYSIRYPRKGLVQVTYDYTVMLSYREDAPESIDDVQVADSSWDAKRLLGKYSPSGTWLVTSDMEELNTKFYSAFRNIESKYEGYLAWDMSVLTYEKMDVSVVNLSFLFAAETSSMRMMQNQAAFEARNIWRRIVGKASFPDFVKPFLAFSYLTQECRYDRFAADAVARSDSQEVCKDPAPVFAYGPLNESRGICTGFSWAFKYLMDEVGIKCICICGTLKATNMPHMWNLIELNGLWYHIDVTQSVGNGPVNLQTFLQTDVAMRCVNEWDSGEYPAAKGVQFDYDMVEDYLADHDVELIDDGAVEKYMFPEEIIV